MYVTFYENGCEKEYHIEDPIDHDRELRYISGIEWIQADGHELEAIQQKYLYGNGGYTIPMPRGQVSRWYGDIARSIHLNLISGRRFAND